MTVQERLLSTYKLLLQLITVSGHGELGSRKTGLSSSPPPAPPPSQYFNTDRSKVVLLLWFLSVTCSCCPYLYFGSPIMWVTFLVLGSWMITCLGKSCSFALPRVPFVNCCQFMYLVISFLVLGGRIWDLIVSVPDHCLSFYFTLFICLCRELYFQLREQVIPKEIPSRDRGGSRNFERGMHKILGSRITVFRLWPLFEALVVASL